MNRNKKLLLSAISGLVLMTVLAAAVTFYLAGTPTKVKGELNSSSTGSGTAVVDKYTTIDNIILQANSDESFTYNVIELYADKPSALKELCAVGANQIEGFAEYVFNGNKSEAIEELKMAAGHIVYYGFKASDIKASIDDTKITSATGQSYSYDEVLAIITNADFVYVSNVGGDAGYNQKNDIPEDVYQILAPYAVGKYNPLVIDKPSKKESTGSGSTVTPDDPNPGQTVDNTSYIGNVVANVFDKKGIYYSTAVWANGMTASNYFNRNGSSYLKINGKTQKSAGNWYEVTSGEDTLDMSKMLVISANGNMFGTAGAISTEIFKDSSLVANENYTSDAIQADSMIYDITEGIIYKTAYNSKYVRPSLVMVEELKLSDILNNSDSYDLDSYDMVIFEDDYASADADAKLVTTADGTKDIYNTIAGLMYGNIHVVYGESLKNYVYSNSGSTPVVPDDDDDDDVPDALNNTNYEELYYNVATTSHIAKYENILVTTQDEFGIICKSNSAASCKVIADIINKSAFRGTGGPSSSANMFTVLEIQPCYPIDEELAIEIGKTNPVNSEYSLNFGNGNYYLKPCDVLSGVTKEQIYADDDYTLEDGKTVYPEYYAWELSKAKLAETFGISADKINLVQMSSEELACNKTEILGNYDLVYLGGNFSALKSAGEFKSITAFENGQNILSKTVSNYLDFVNELPIYTLYSHTGDWVVTRLYYDQAAFKLDTTPANSVYANGKYLESFESLNGNDITYNNYKNLLAYINAGCPVLVSDALASSYEVANEEGYLQNSLDPDSNMFKVLEACNKVASKKGDSGNVLWGLDVDAVTTTDNDSGRLGSTLSGSVTVFNDDANAAIMNTYANSSLRPKLTMVGMPAKYDMYDKNTKLENSEFTYSFRVSGSTDFTVSLDVDRNANNLFTDDGENIVRLAQSQLEATESATGETVYSFTCDLAMTGPIYWQLTVTDKTSKSSVAYSSISYVNVSEDKQRVNILQLLPDNCTGAQGVDSLLFCPICQQSYDVLEYNPLDNSGDRTSYNAYYGGSGTKAKLTDGSFKLSYNNKSYTINMGLHEHTFGIPLYDSTSILDNKYVGYDDWDKNVADEVSDLYDFDIDIMELEEYEALAKEIQKAYVMTAQEIAGYVAKYDAYVSSGAIEVEEGVALTDAQKARKAKQCEYLEMAEKYYQVYTKIRETNDGNPIKDVDGSEIPFTTYDAEETLKATINEMIAAVDTVGLAGFNKLSGTDELKEELTRLITTRRYSDYFSISGSAARYNEVSHAFLNGRTILDDYIRYTDAKNKEVELNKMYKYYLRMAAYDNFLMDCYDCVILGPAEIFGADDLTDYNDYTEADDFDLRAADGFTGQGLRDLVDYVKQDGQVILFHDTIQASAKDGSVNISKRLRELFGMDRFHMERDESAELTNYVKYNLKSEYASDSDKNGVDDRYFLTNLYFDNSKDKYSKWKTNINSKSWITNNKYYYTVTQLTDSVAIGQTGGNQNKMSSPYRYVEYEYSYASFYNVSSTNNGNYGTDRASRNNEGLITTYPFTLGAQLNISGTHAQSYAIDVEADKMTVWYTLAGGTNAKKGSSMNAATPNDGMDNYFIYSYGNVFYCGAGHSKITGPGTDNNDERRLYINIICNSVRDGESHFAPVVLPPSVEIFDHVDGEDTNNLVVEDTREDFVTAAGDGVLYNIDASKLSNPGTTVPEFKLVADADANSEGLESVEVFYDFNLKDSDVKKYVAWLDAVAAGELIEDTSAFKTSDDFKYDAANESQLKYSGEATLGKSNKLFAGTGASTTITDDYEISSQPIVSGYVYVVVRVVDKEGNVTLRFVKIITNNDLYDLT